MTAANALALRGLGVAVLVASTAVCSLAARKGEDPRREQPPYASDAFPSAYAPLPRADTLIVHATILDGAGHRIDDGDVLMTDGKIAGIGRGL